MPHRGLGQPHLGFRQRELPAAIPSASPSGLEPRHGALADQLPLELGQRREDAEHEAASGGRGVDLRALTGEHPQAHAAARQVLHGVDQVGEVPAEAVELSNDEHIALSQGAWAAVESRPGVPLASGVRDVLFHLRDAFRAGDVWLARSRRYGDIRKALLSAPAVADADRSLPVPASPRDWLAERRFALDEGLRRLVAAARAGAVAGGSIEDSVLRVERTETAVPEGAADLVADLYRRLPEARITDILCHPWSVLCTPPGAVR